MTIYFEWFVVDLQLESDMKYKERWLFCIVCHDFEIISEMTDPMSVKCWASVAGPGQYPYSYMVLTTMNLVMHNLTKDSRFLFQTYQ